MGLMRKENNKMVSATKSRGYNQTIADGLVQLEGLQDGAEVHILPQGFSIIDLVGSVLGGFRSATRSLRDIA